MRGHDVEVAQHRLHNNRYGEFYKPSHTDGVYGPETAAATKHAKYALGFPGSQINQRYDAPLDSRLSGDRPLGAMYALRRRHRQKPPEPKGGNKVKAADLAVQEAGTHESGDSNCQKYGAWYGLNCAPWCAIFVSWCESHAGNTWFRYSYVPNIYSAAMHGDHGMSFTTHPVKGDLALFHFSGGEYPASHVGIVLDESPWKWISGNWSGAVSASTSSRESVVRFVRMP